jgi:hypothetical protein
VELRKRKAEAPTVQQGDWQAKTCPVHGAFEGSHHWCAYMEPFVALEPAQPAEDPA